MRATYKSVRRAQAALAGTALLALLVAPATAQVSPQPALHTTIGGGTGVGPAVTPTGGFPASVPLDLPKPRGALPVPLSIIHSGSTAAGAAGAGWEVPLSYVRLSDSTWRRKPKYVSAGEPEQAAERVYVSLGGGEQLMVPHGNVYVPFVDTEYSELRRDGDVWRLRTLDNVEFVFTPSSQVGETAWSGFADIWMLTEIRDLTGTDRVAIEYTTQRHCGTHHELNIARLSYGFDADDETPLYEIKLEYEPWEPGPSCNRFGSVHLEHMHMQRTMLLRRVAVDARNNLDPTEGSKTIRSYDLAYERDVDLGTPRLTTVTQEGEDGVSAETLPVASFTYGTLTWPSDDPNERELRYGPWVEVPRPSLVTMSPYEASIAATDIDRELLASQFPFQFPVPGAYVYAHLETTKSRHLMRDMTGDGVVDIVIKLNSQWHVYPGQATGGVPTWGAPITWDGGNGPEELFHQTSFRFTDESLNENCPYGSGSELCERIRRAMVTDEIWTQLIDWNGDGRLDVIHARVSYDPRKWHVWLNLESPTKPIDWYLTNVDISQIKNHLAGNGLARHDFTDIFDDDHAYWHDYFPLERSRSWARVETRDCPDTFCPSGVPFPADHYRTVGSDTITEWQLADRNGDGFPDFVANRQPVQLCRETMPLDGVCGSPPGPYQGANCTAHREWLTLDLACVGDQPEENDAGADYFLNVRSPFSTITPGPFSTTPVRIAPYVAHWTTGVDYAQMWPVDVDLDENFSRQAWALGDRFATGTLNAESDYTSSFRTDRHFCGSHAGSTISRQLSGAIDVNGDGRLDQVGAASAAINDGSGFSALHRIVWMDELGDAFPLSEARGDCNGNAMSVGGFTDMDGDGVPELIRSGHQGNLYMARLVVPAGEDIHGAGRLKTISNGHGATTHIRYANAKAVYATEHAVPFPEIVVDRVQTVIDDDPAANLAPIHFSYQTARLEYDGLAGRWQFPGYQRVSMLVGGQAEETQVDGVMTTFINAPPANPGADYETHVIAHRPIAQYARQGTFDLDDFRANQYDDSSLAFKGASTAYKTKLIAAPSSVPFNEALDCDDLIVEMSLPSLWGYGGPSGRCKTAGIIYTQSTQAWEGVDNGSAPPGLSNTEVASEIDEVDVYGRPTRLRQRGDTRLTDDDVCTTVTYATPPGGGPFPSVPSSVVLTDCGYGSVDVGQPPGTPEILAAMHYRYDGLPAGEVSRGRLTTRIIDRYDASGYLDSHVLDSFTYDVFGEVRTVSGPRAIGSLPMQTTTFERDAFGASVTETTEQATFGTQLVQLSARSTWPSTGTTSTSPNGIVTRSEFDGHGRLIRDRVTDAKGEETTLSTIEYDPEGRWIETTTYPSDTAPDDEGSASDAQVTRIGLDPLRRLRFRQSKLGVDYDHTTMVSDFVEYDAFGRVAFAAAPFQHDEYPFVPESLPEPVFGATSVYDLRGRTVRVVEAMGRDELSIHSDPAADRFVTILQHSYVDGKAVTWRRGPDENDQSSPRWGHLDESRRTATGREIERARVHNSAARLDLVHQTWDRLGRLTRISRFVDPDTGIVPVSWDYSYDSLGRVLSMTEPGMATRFSEYDERGNVLESWWDDGVIRHITRTQYDQFSRPIDKQLIKRTSGVELVESHDTYHYDTHSGSPDQPQSDLLGRLSWAQTDGVGAVYQAYDALGRTASTSYRYQSQGQLVRESAVYNLPGRLLTMQLETQPTNDEIAYAYDSAGRVREISDGSQTHWLAHSVTFDGHYEEVELGNGVRETYPRALDGRREPLGWSADTQQGVYRQVNHAFDASGRVTMEQRETPFSSEMRGYQFDSLGRLTGAVHTAGGGVEVETYTHDAIGNLLSRTATTGIGDRIYEPDTTDPDRLCRYGAPGTSGACQFTYDAAGNVISDTTYGPLFQRSFQYDAGGRIVYIQRDEHVAKFSYGPAGRAHTQIDGWVDREHWHYGDLIEIQERGTGTQVERHIPGPLGIVATLRHRQDMNTVVYRHGDGLANHVFTDVAGQVVQHARYTTFGEASDTTPNTDPLTTTDDLWNGGDDLRELGVVLLGPRAYDPDLGRFLQRDPISIVSRASTANPYAFGFSDPVNYADPSGLTPSETRSNGGLTSDQTVALAAVASLFPFLNLLEMDGHAKRSPRAGGVVSVPFHPGVMAGNAIPGFGCSHCPRTLDGIVEDFGEGLMDGVRDLATDALIRGLKGPAWYLYDSVPQSMANAELLVDAMMDDPVGTVASMASPYSLGHATGQGLFVGGIARTGPAVASSLAKIRARAARGTAKICFAAGTPVLTDDGLVPIEDIEVGDSVWARDDNSGKEGWRVVTELFETPDQEVLELEFRADDGTTERLRVTPGHPLWSLEKDGWKSAGDLHVGESVDTLRGSMTLKTVSQEHQLVTVYNFEVEELHTYFVGEAGIWAHNWCPGAGLRGQSLKAIKRAKPKGWRTLKVDRGSGWKWVDQNGVERLRFMRPNGRSASASQWSRQSNGYFRWKNESGDFLDIDGNVVPLDHPQFNELTHIMYEGL